MTSRASLLAAALAALVSGCVETHPAGVTNAHAYYRSHEHYRVRLDGDALLPAPWTAEAGPEAPQLVTRPVGLYFPRTYGALRVPRWDLRFVHEETGGVMWSRTLLLAPAWAQDPLEVMLERTVISLTLPHAVAPDLFGDEVRAAGVAIRRAGPARVDGRDGRYLTFDVTRAREDDLSIERVTVVAVPLAQPYRHLRWTAPAVAIFAHASAPARHRAQHADFERFVSRVDFAP